MPSRGVRRKTPRTAIWVQRSPPEPPRPSRDPAVAFHLILRVGRDEKDAVVVAGPAETPTELISRTQAKVKMLLDEARPMLERLDERVAEVNRRLIREH